MAANTTASMPTTRRTINWASTHAMKELNPNWVHLRDELALLNQDLLHEIRRRAPQGQQGQLDQLQGTRAE